MPATLLYVLTSVHARHTDLSLAMHSAQPAPQPSNVLCPGTAARGPLVGKEAVGSGLGGVGGVVVVVVGPGGVVTEGVPEPVPGL